MQVGQIHACKCAKAAHTWSYLLMQTDKMMQIGMHTHTHIHIDAHTHIPLRSVKLL